MTMQGLVRRGEGGLWGSFNELRREIDQLFEDFFSPRWGLTAMRTRAGFVPSMELREREDEYFIRAELPGIKPEDVRINVDGNVLTVSGERREEREERERGYYYSEFDYGSFSRSIQLPRGVDTDKIRADYENGVLEIHVPKSAETRPRAIPIGRGRREAPTPQLTQAGEAAREEQRAQQQQQSQQQQQQQGGRR